MYKSLWITCMLAVASVATGDWVIQYTGYTDNICNTVDNSVTGQIFAYTCAPEFQNAPRSGMITAINDNYLSSCDYSDTACTTQRNCQNYNNGQCYGSSSSPFSNKYTWIGATGTVVYTSYKTQDCSGEATVTSDITLQVCGAEFDRVPSSGKITEITTEWLISCDYSDTTCTDQIICVNYTNSACSDSNAQYSFSDKYSWSSTSSSGSAPTSLPSNSAADSSQATVDSNGNKNDWEIAYIAFTDNTCDKEAVDNSMTGQIFAFTCASEYKSQPSSGKIVYINSEWLRSCDYSDANCTVPTVCVDYNNSQCYNSGSLTSFSNKYSWSAQSDGTFSITYSSYNSQNCPDDNVALSGEIFEGVCAIENTNSKSGMITEIDDNTLVSCDYSDENCKDLILCEKYNNAQCYGSSVTSFSNMYVWKRSSSSASAVSAAFSLGFAALVAFFVLF